MVSFFYFIVLFIFIFFLLQGTYGTSRKEEEVFLEEHTVGHTYACYFGYFPTDATDLPVLQVVLRCVCVCARARACVRLCVCVWCASDVFVCVFVYMDVWVWVWVWVYSVTKALHRGKTSATRGRLPPAPALIAAQVSI